MNYGAVTSHIVSESYFTLIKTQNTKTLETRNHHVLKLDEKFPVCPMKFTFLGCTSIRLAHKPPSGPGSPEGGQFSSVLERWGKIKTCDCAVLLSGSWRCLIRGAK